VRRHLIGIIALLCLLGYLAFRIWPPQETWQQVLEGGCARGGALAAVAWLAYPDIRRMPGWLWGVLLAILVVVAIRPRTVLLAIPVIVALAILRPRFGRGKK
jgi:hypothetical protein